jgi:hypothetical protein
VQDLLRDPVVLADWPAGVVVEQGRFESLGQWPAGAGNQSEIIVNFALPDVACSFGVVVMSDEHPQTEGVYFFVDFVPAATTAGGRPYAVTVGAMQNRSGSVANTTQDLQLLPPGSPGDADASIELRIFVDNLMAEAYFANGRVAMTVVFPATATPSGTPNPPAFSGTAAFVTCSGNAVTALSARAWAVQQIWVTPEEVISTPPLQ